MSALRTQRDSGAGPLETATVLHVAIFLVATTWALGGNGLWLRPELAAWGSLGLLITIAGLYRRKSRGLANERRIRHLWPFALFNLLVLGSLLTPGFSVLHFQGEVMYAPRDIPITVPTAAIPRDAAMALWMFDAIYLSCFNLSLFVRRRPLLRALLIVAAANAFALAVFGTVQKFAQAQGPYFGAVKTRQPLFFSTFLYHNHWGAFIILMTLVCLGLIWHVSSRWRGRTLFDTPAFLGLVAVFFLAATVPMSGSRSCTILLGLILAGGFCVWLSRTVRHRRHRGAPVARPIAGAIVAAALACAAVEFLAKDMIETRLALTRDQIATMRAQGGIGSRIALYRDTWTMASRKPVFGWGMASYQYVFTLFNTQGPDRHDHLPKFYSQAHNDWLQALAEYGFVGSSLIALCAIVPLWSIRRSRLSRPIPACLLTGCGALLLYAWVEFPFGNVAVVLSWWLCYFTGTSYARLLPAEDSLSAKSAPIAVANIESSARDA